MIRYAQFADRYGWTPTQVDDLPATVAYWLLPIAVVLDDVRGGGRG